MGAAPSRETHKRGLVSLEQLTGIGVDNRNGSSNGATSTHANLSSSNTPFSPNSPSLWQEQSHLLAQSNISSVNCTSKHNMVDANNSKANRNVNVQGTGASKKQEIVLIPLTKYYFPSPDCPLFVQFHKARCDAAVNYYFRRPGNPGDLSCIPHYGNPDQTEHGDHNNNSNNTDGDGDGGGNANNINRTDYYNNNNNYQKENNSLSYPSREALYRGVIDHVEEMLFDTDAEMREAYLSQGITVNCVESSQHANNAQHCNTVRLCEESDVNNINKENDNKLHTKEQIVRDQETETKQMELSNNIERDSKTRSVENKEDITSGCFGFVSMEEEVASYSNAMLAAVHSRTNSAEQSSKLHSHSTTDCNTNNNNHINNSNKSSNPSIISHNANAHDAHVSNQENNEGNNNDKLSSIELCSSSSPLPPIQEISTSITQSNRNTDDNSKYYTNNDNNDESKKSCKSISKAALCDDLSLLSSAANHFNELMHLPPPIAAPLAAMVYLTKSAGEQNLSRITHLAACTYYYQLVHAGVLVSHSTQSTHGCNTATFTETTNTAHVATPLSNITTAATNNDNSSSNTDNNIDDRYISIDVTEQTTKQSQANVTMQIHKNNVDHDTICMNEKNITHEPTLLPSSLLFAAAPCIERVLPPMDTFSFSVLLTNIPILSFLYEMK